MAVSAAITADFSVSQSFFPCCVFRCLPLLPPAVSLSVSCVFSVLLFQHCFMMPQSLGVIGGKPNSAHYFIGYVGECPEYCKDFPSISPQLKMFVEQYSSPAWPVVCAAGFIFSAGKRLL